MSRNLALTRRKFLGAGAAAIAATALPSRTAQAQTAAPKAIAALPNLSGKARPFTNGERQARIERARQLMTSAKIDAIVLSNSTSSSVYFADMRPLWRRAPLGPGSSRALQAVSRLSRI